MVIHMVQCKMCQNHLKLPLGWSRRRKTAQALALRARIVLACSDSTATNITIA